MKCEKSGEDYVAFRIGTVVTNDLAYLIAAAGMGLKVEWYTRDMMRFMAAATGAQWNRFAMGPALSVTPSEIGENAV